MFVLVWKVGFFLDSFCKVIFILFWLVFDLGLIVIWIIGFGNFIDLRIIRFFLLYSVFLVVVFFKLIVVVIFLV